MKPIRALIADDHALVRAGIRALVEKIDDVSVIAETGEGGEALRLIKELKPDVVLLDVTMPGLSGLEVLAESRKYLPNVRVIILTVHDEAEYAMQALRAGAAGFLPKSAAANELQVAIETVSRGEIYVSDEVSRRTLLEYSRGRIEHRLARLTPRQREILTLIAEGLNTKDIGRRLNISAKTVESHRAQLMERLNIHDVASLVRFAIKVGLIRVE
ncbi:MAG TPA: response regulator transcription factor [Pyrinomonadaceae bacterium]|nr:response regulator transcription factor [Pyrinomonadaceae bacterium]